MSLLDRVLEVAAREVGVRELGRNRGPRVEMYQRIAGANPGDPWCAAFVSWCFVQASIAEGIPCPFMPTPGALKLWRYNMTQQRKDPAPGRVFVIDHGGGLGHVGFVKDVADAGIMTIEGNTSDGGSREGDGVYQRLRNLGAPIIGYLDFTPPAEEPAVA